LGSGTGSPTIGFKIERSLTINFWYAKVEMKVETGKTLWDKFNRMAEYPFYGEWFEIWCRSKESG
jgi:hypothetical protein